MDFDHLIGQPAWRSLVAVSAQVDTRPQTLSGRHPSGPGNRNKAAGSSGRAVLGSVGPPPSCTTHQITHLRFPDRTTHQIFLRDGPVTPFPVP
jgi:hypothetical protein